MAPQTQLKTQKTNDPYHSRVTGEPYVTERDDPVVYSNGDGILTDDQLQSYERNRFLTFDSLFSEDEVAHLLQQTEVLKANEGLKNSDLTICEPGSDEIRSFFHVHDHDPVFKALGSDKR